MVAISQCCWERHLLELCRGWKSSLSPWFLSGSAVKSSFSRSSTYPMPGTVMRCFSEGHPDAQMRTSGSQGSHCSEGWGRERENWVYPLSTSVLGTESSLHPLLSSHQPLNRAPEARTGMGNLCPYSFLQTQLGNLFQRFSGFHLPAE